MEENVKIEKIYLKLNLRLLLSVPFFSNVPFTLSKLQSLYPWPGIVFILISKSNL